MFKQICFFRKNPDMTAEEFLDYYENQHSQLSKRMGRSPSIRPRATIFKLSWQHSSSTG